MLIRGSRPAQPSMRSTGDSKLRSNHMKNHMMLLGITIHLQSIRSILAIYRSYNVDAPVLSQFKKQIIYYSHRHQKTYLPRCSMYGILTNIYPINEPNVDTYSSTMEHMGQNELLIIASSQLSIQFDNLKLLLVVHMYHIQLQLAYGGPTVGSINSSLWLRQFCLRPCHTPSHCRCRSLKGRRVHPTF